MRPGTRIFPRPVFCWAEGGRECPRPQRSQLPSRNPPRACRHAALAVRRDLRGALPHPGLRLRQRRAGEARFKSEEPGFQYSRFSNPTVAMFEQRMAALRRRRGRARHRDRHGGGHRRADGPAQGRRPRGRREGAVRLLPLRRRGLPAALRRRLDAGRRHRPRPMAQGACGRTPRPSSSRARPIRRSR